jgi:putative ubiquitin-RnfH superfamily antitoxin RatB of RatAB toxin-antitoxin module
MEEEIQVEVAYALPREQIVLRVRLAKGATIAEAIERSGILGRHPEIDLSNSKVGVYGRLVRLDAHVHDRDRVEIYRPLPADPKQARRERVRESIGTKRQRLPK